jgi:DNA (cytosine-5)-methyltransferase 1
MCGIGGATRGFLDAGIRVIRGVDLDASCKKTFEENNKPATFLVSDIQNLTSDVLLSGIDLSANDKLALIVCAPCQPFSRAGLGKPKDSHEIILAINRLICEIIPDFVFAENAPGFWKRYPSIYKEFLAPFNELNYRYDCNVINLKDYGVPQNRYRYFFLASKDYDISLPDKTHGTATQPYVTVGDVIRKYPRLKAGGKSETVPNHTCSNLSEVNLERLRNTPKNGGSRKDWPEHLVLRCHKKSKGHSDVYGRMSWGKVAPTLTCRCISISNGRFGHPTQNRGISVREAAALQTFKDEFIFHEPKSVAAKHVGNAVPPLASMLVGQKIVETVRQNETDSLFYFEHNSPEFFLAPKPVCEAHDSAKLIAKEYKSDFI